MTVKGVVARIEDNVAVVLLGEEGLEVRWPLSLLPEVQENDLLGYNVKVNVPASEVRKMTPKTLMECLAGER
jgi:hypothetical protein